MAAFSRTRTVVADRIMQRALDLVVWLESMTQAQVDAVETFLFPDPTPAERLQFMDRIRTLYEQANMNTDQSPEAQAFRDEYLAYRQEIEGQIP